MNKWNKETHGGRYHISSYQRGMGEGKAKWVKELKVKNQNFHGKCDVVHTDVEL